MIDLNSGKETFISNPTGSNAYNSFQPLIGSERFLILKDCNGLILFDKVEFKAEKMLMSKFSANTFKNSFV